MTAARTRRLRLTLGVVAAVGAVAVALAIGVGVMHRGEPPAAAAGPAPTVSGAAPSATPSPAAGAAAAPSPTPAPSASPNDPAHVKVVSAGGDVLVDAALQPTLLDASGALAPPAGIAGWYAEPGWARPGDVGTSILVGHITDAGRPDTFSRLTDVHEGDRITVTYPSGRVAVFVVSRSSAEAKADVPNDGTIWDWSAKSPQLRLITCDPTTPIDNGHYEGNFVVWAVPA